jgi:hypothetical protein
VNEPNSESSSRYASRELKILIILIKHLNTTGYINNETTAANKNVDLCSG